MTILSDNFNRTESTNLGTSWTELAGDLRILGSPSALGHINAAIGSGVLNQARRSDDLATADHAVQAKVYQMTTPTGNTARVAVTARGNGTDRVCYLGGYTNSTGGVKTAFLASMNSSGTLSTISSNTDTLAVNDVIRLEVMGDQLTFKKNGTTILGPVTDTVITSGTRAGFTLTVGSSSTSNFELDDWQALDLEAPLDLDAGPLTWTGADLAVNAKTQVATAQAPLTWTGVDLVVNAATVLEPTPADLTWTGSSISIDNDLVLVVGAMPWTGQDLTINAKTQVVLDPAALTWTGQDTASTRWRTYPGWTLPEIAQGAATGPVFSPLECLAVDTAHLLPADQWASVVLNRVPSAGVVVRASDVGAAATLYGASAHSANGVLLFSYLNGVYQGELAFSAPVATEGKRLYLDAVGETLTVSLEDAGVETVVIGPITNALIPGGGFAGISTYQSALDLIPAVDDYAAGDFSIEQGGDPLEITPALMPWTGHDLVVNAMTELDLEAMTLTWSGESISFYDNQYLSINPMTLTWSGQNIPDLEPPGPTHGSRMGANPLIRASRGANPLIGV